jgi:hypothetical protein
VWQAGGRALYGKDQGYEDGRKTSHEGFDGDNDESGFSPRLALSQVHACSHSFEEHAPYRNG